MNWTGIAQILWPLTTAAVAYFVKSYFTHKLKIAEQRCLSEIRSREQEHKASVETKTTIQLQEVEHATKDEEALRQLVLDHWSQICEVVRVVESPDRADGLDAAVDDFTRQISDLRTAFTQVNLFLPPEVTSAFATFFSNSALQCAKYSTDGQVPRAHRFKILRTHVIDLQGNLSQHLRFFFDLESTPYSDLQSAVEDSPVCDTCGSITVRNGACYRCMNCGNSMGCS